MPVYTDIDFSFKAHPITGDVLTKTDNRAIAQSLKNLIRTKMYERGFNVDVYSTVDTALFELFTPITVSTIEKDLKLLIDKFEPRVDLVSITVYEDGSNGISVSIKYNILNREIPETLSIKLERIR